jgi:hypothetical protein
MSCWEHAPKIHESGRLGLILRFRCKVRAPSFGAVAQLAERLHGMQEVTGSIPVSSTICSLFVVLTTELVGRTTMTKCRR